MNDEGIWNGMIWLFFALRDAFVLIVIENSGMISLLVSAEATQEELNHRL
jgi:hypothetical protein